MLPSVTRTSKSWNVPGSYDQRIGLRNSMRPRLRMPVDAEMLRRWRMRQTLHLAAQRNNVYPAEDVS